MQLATMRAAGGEIPVAVDPARGVVAIADLPAVSGPAAQPLADTMAVLATVPPGQLDQLVRGVADSRFRPLDQVSFAPPYRRPRKIWGIGLNYLDHAADLAESVPEEPASFLKADHTIIGPSDRIELPAQSCRVTGEAELGLIIGRYCRDVPPEQALDYVWGVCPVLDQTAEDILARNPRFLTRAKNFPGFFSFGPTIVPLDEAVQVAGSLSAVEVATVLNGRVHRRNTIEFMRYDPAYLVSFTSRVMPLFPGDIISPGTPGAVPLSPGDLLECRIPGVGVLRNRVG